MKKRIICGALLALFFVLSVGAAETSSELGELVFSVDFENMTTVANTNIVGKTTEAFGSQNVILYNQGMGMTYGLGSPVKGGSQMLSMVANDYHGGVVFQGYSLSEPGTYTFVYDRYYAKSVAYQSCAINTSPSAAQNVHASTSLTEISTSVTLNEGDKAISYVKIQFAKYQSGTADSPVYVDNVRLYYKAPDAKTNVVVLYSDKTTDALKTHEALTAGDLVTLPTAKAMKDYVPEGKYFKGFMVGNTFLRPGATHILTKENVKEETLYIYPLYESIPDSGYGELIFCENFETMSGALPDQSVFPSRMMGAYDDQTVQLYARGSGTSYEVVSIPGKGKMLKLSGCNYPQLGLVNLGLTKPGLYTVSFDYYLEEDATISFLKHGFDQKTVALPQVSIGSVQNEFGIKYADSASPISSFDIQSGFAAPALYLDNLCIYYTELSAPASLPTNSVRTAGHPGLRFVSFAENTLRDWADEYGYIVTVADDTAHDYAKELVLAAGEREEGKVFTNAYAIRYMLGIGYQRDQKDVIYSLDGSFLPDSLSMGDDGVYYTAVLTGIPTVGYAKEFVIRSYAVIDGVVFYGNVLKKSLYAAASEIAGAPGYVTQEYIEHIIETVEGANAAQ